MNLPPYTEISYADAINQLGVCGDVDYSGYKFLQLKYDGIFGRCVTAEGFTTIYSKTDSEKMHKMSLNLPDCTLLGEYLINTTWSNDSPIRGKLIVFDCLNYMDTDISLKPYAYRMAVATHILEEHASMFPLQGRNFIVCETYSLKQFDSIWGTHVLGVSDFEGVVLRKDEAYGSRLVKIKRTLTQDYIFLGIVEEKDKYGSPKGRAGAIRIGAYQYGSLTELGTVGGLTDELKVSLWNHEADFIGHVVEVTGKKQFESGLLRHPAFVRFHPDKDATKCTIT